MISPRGVIVPHRNRTRFLVSGRFCLRLLQGAGRPVSMLRHQDGGFPSRRRLAPPGEAARAPLPRGPRQARHILWRRARCARPCRLAFSLHGGSLLPTRRVASSYTEGRFSLHGGFGFPTRWMCWGHWTVSQLLPVLPISNSNPQLAIGNIGIGNISTLATLPHHLWKPPVVHVGRVWYNTCHDHKAPTKWDDCPHG